MYENKDKMRCYCGDMKRWFHKDKETCCYWAKKECFLWLELEFIHLFILEFAILWTCAAN